MAEEEFDKGQMLRGALGLGGAAALAGAYGKSRKNKKATDPRFDVEEAGKLRSKMLREQISKSAAPLDTAAIDQQAYGDFSKSMQAAQAANMEKYRAGMAGNVQPGQQLQMFGQATEKAQEEAAKTSREAYKQAGEQKLKQRDDAYNELKAEEARLKKEREDKLFNKIPRMVGAAGVAINKLAESGFLDDIIGVGGAIAGGAGGVLGGPAGIAAGAAGGFQAGKELGGTVQDSINALGKDKDDDDPEDEDPPTEEPSSEEEKTEEEREAARRRRELQEVVEGDPEEVQQRLAERRAEREAVGEGGFEDDQEEIEVAQDVTGREGALRDLLGRNIERGTRIDDGSFEQDDDSLDVEQRPPVDEQGNLQLVDDLAKERLADQQTRREGGVGEGGFEQDADELDVLGVGQSQIGGVAVENESRHLATLAEAGDYPPLPADIINVDDFNDATREIFESSDPASVNAAYIAAGVRPPNNEMPTAEQIAQARAALNKPGTELNLLAKALNLNTGRRDALRNNLAQ